MKLTKKYFRRQKLIGIVAIVVGILSAIVGEGDITAAVVLVPLGLYVLFTKTPVMYVMHDDDYEDLDSGKKDDP